MRSLLSSASLAVLLFALPALSVAQPWSDNFDSYALGSGLHGQGGWHGWDGNAAADAYITDLYSRSAPHSVDITPTSDMVHEFTGVTSGQWTIAGWNYIPSGSTGEQYFILLNTYNNGGPYAWSLDLLFDSTAGTVSSVEGSGTASIVNDQWVEVRVEFDLDVDTQTIYYNGAVLDVIGWSQGGVLEFAALDLFSNGGSSIYWDDLSLDSGAVPVQPTSWGHIKSSFK